MQATICQKKLSLFLVLLLVLGYSIAIGYVAAVSVTLDYNTSYALPGPAQITATIVANQAFNGSISPTNLQSFLTLPAVTFTDGSFTQIDPSTVKSIVTVSLTGSDVGSFTTNLAVTDTTNTSTPQVVATAQLSSSFYYDAPPQVVTSKLIPNATNSSNVLVQFETDVPSSCKFDYVSTTYDQAVFSLYLSSQSNTVHTYALNDAKQKDYTFYVVCKSLASKKIMTSSYVYTFSISRTPPIVISHQPSIVNNGGGMQLSVQTDVASLCKYDTVDTDFSTMGTYFDYVYGTTHQALIPLTANAIKIYVRCSDKTNNVMTSSYVVNYAKQTAPSATIDLSDYVSGNYLTDGLHTVTVTATPQLASPPNLFVSYIMDGGIKTTKIPLILLSTNASAISQIYTGSLQIMPNEFSGVAYFDFDGTDLLGNHGTQLTGETSVIVLARNPNQVPSQAVKQLDAATTGTRNPTVEISWGDVADPYFDHYEIQKFYATDLGNKLSSSSTAALSIRDRDLIEGKTYVYAIISINKALKKSAPVYTSPITIVAVSDVLSNTGTGTDAIANQKPSSSNQAVGSSYVMPQYLSSNLQAIQQRLDNLLSDFKQVQQTQTPLFSLVGAVQSNAKLISQIDTAITNSRKKVFTNNQDVADQVTALLNTETAAKQQFISNVRIIESSSQKQTLSKDDYALLFGEYLAAKRWDGNPSDFDFVLEATQKWMEKLTITQHISTMGVTYYNGAQDVKTVISKDVVGEIPPQSQLYEFMGDQTAQARWESGEYQRLVKFMVTNSAENVSYYFAGVTPKEQLATLKTIFFPLNPFDSQQGTTGNFFATNFSLGSLVYYVMGFLAIILLGLYYRSGSVSHMFDFSTIQTAEHSAEKSLGSKLTSVFSSTKRLFGKKSKGVSANVVVSNQTNTTSAAQTLIDQVPLKNDGLTAQEMAQLQQRATTQSPQMHAQTAVHNSKKEPATFHSLSDVIIDPKEIVSFKVASNKATHSTTKTSDVSGTDDEEQTQPVVTAVARASTPRRARYGSLVEELSDAEQQLKTISTNDMFRKIPTAIKEYRVPAQLCFVTSDGKRISTLLELAFELSQMRDDVYAHHVNSSKHDFAIWINDVFGLPKHAWVLKEIRDKHALAQAIFMLVEGGIISEQNDNEQ